MEKASVAVRGDSRTAMDGSNPKQSCPLEWVPQGLTEQLQKLTREGKSDNRTAYHGIKPAKHMPSLTPAQFPEKMPRLTQLLRLPDSVGFIFIYTPQH
jgi:hypothetical protein